MTVRQSFPDTENTQSRERYSRHILLDELGESGQEKIRRAHILAVGAGGLGSPACYYMASAGIGKITLVDDDRVELSNLQRQILHPTDRIGENKALSGAMTIRQLNPDVEVIPVTSRLDTGLIHALLQDVTLVMDCSDNFATRHVINNACVARKIPLVSGAALRFDGQVCVFDLRRADAPCYSCLYSADLDFTDRKAAQFGVFAPMIGAIGTIQAAEALKLIAGIGESLSGRLLLLDALKMQWTEILIERSPQCPVCASRR
ncbi:HesA/MoeB/ThiF family protein [Oxalobacter vibrioformis]|uniref:HesA/MoeB/ThiF family protein n=1 Tax=Oxalobacter vibrioformis TaxID=933080 RepID=A0A9E9P4G4_9BURK|nr:HesA/MoeB/ThiF family protein [Oxalobacter vibrioformis]NLC23773.1 HesA/MoeB/ThiF family protein [Oxalobacter sp.]WAW10066.1 HesA/MoeB/ThiF family protein [Oxalobacter vibrioformis]